jgi:hypothetical protein
LGEGFRKRGIYRIMKTQTENMPSPGHA